MYHIIPITLAKLDVQSGGSPSSSLLKHSTAGVATGGRSSMCSASMIRSMSPFWVRVISPVSWFFSMCIIINSLINLSVLVWLLSANPTLLNYVD